MNFDLSEALRTLKPGSIFQIANAARAPGDYLFNTIMPEIPQPDYQAKSGYMTVRSVMPGLVGMDSPYPPSGVIELSVFNEETAKFAHRVDMPERALRQMQTMLQRVYLTSGGDRTVMTNAIVREALNFNEKLLVQPHLDLMEYLRGKALQGAIDWTFGPIRLQVNYGIPSGNFLPQRVGALGYGGANSLFWSDIQALRKLLRYNVRAFIAHPDTIAMIRNNPANSLAVTNDSFTSVQIRKINTIGGFTQDTQDQVTLLSYGKEGEIVNPANPAATIRIPFMPRGAILAVANNEQNTAYLVGIGSTQPPNNRVGYTHISPTTESGGLPGRWSEVYVPQEQPWSFVGRAVTNGIPVIEDALKIAWANTDMV